MDAYFLVRTPSPAQFVLAANALPTVRTARLLVGGAYDAFVALHPTDAASVAAQRQAMYDNGANGTSTLCVLDSVQSSKDAPWYAADAAVNVLSVVTVAPGATATVLLALGARNDVTGLAATVGEFDIVVKTGADTPLGAEQGIVALGGIAGVHATVSSYVLPEPS